MAITFSITDYVNEPFAVRGQLFMKHFIKQGINKKRNSGCPPNQLHWYSDGPANVETVLIPHILEFCQI